MAGARWTCAFGNACLADDGIFRNGVLTTEMINVEEVFRVLLLAF